MAFLLCAVAVMGQNKQEVIRLKNGSTVKGAVVGEVNDSIAMQTADGSVFIFATGDIAERTAEATSLARQVEAQQAASAQSVTQRGVATAQSGVTAKPAPVMGSDGVQYVYVQPEKSPALAGILSYLFPGAGQFYYGNSRMGWIDFSEHVTCLVMMELGQRIYNANVDTNTDNAAVGLSMYLVGTVWGVVNQICSIVDAVKGTKRVNRENGYAMFDVGGGVSVGARPQLTYERPEYAMQMPGTLNAGMGFRITF